MICKNCQAEIENNSTVCPYCNVGIKKSPVLEIVGIALNVLLVSPCCCCLPFGIPGLIFSIKAFKNAQNNDAEAARKNAIIGLILGGVGLVIAPIFWLVMALLFGGGSPKKYY